MPATYAHWRFGNDCLKTLPQDIANIVNKHRDVFNYGTQGPDIFFFYKAILPNEVNKYGSNFHRKPCKEILRIFKEGYSKTKDKDSALSYIIGFICHFNLDSHCHNYIEKACDETVFTHARIETQFEKRLMIKDGKDPIKTRLSSIFHPTKAIASTISDLYGHYDDKIVYRSIVDYSKCLDLLKYDNKIKRNFIINLMKKAKAENFLGLLMNNEEYIGIETILLRLEKLYEKALKRYQELAVNVYNYINDKEELNDFFNRTLDKDEGYKSIPFFTLEEEENYIVEKF